MADFSDSPDSQTSLTTESEQDLARRRVQELKRDLEGWREALLPLRSILLWEKPHHPIIIFGVTTVIFSLIWFLEPSVMTTFAVMGLVIIGLDFVVPFVSPYLTSRMQWTGTQESQFEEICEKILHFRTHVSEFVQALAILKEERPKIYLLVLFGVLAFFAWLGQIMNNLFLTYFIVVTVLMVPGLRQKGLLQHYLLKYWLIFKRLLYGRLHVIKSKAN